METVSFFQRPRRVLFWDIPIEALVVFLKGASASQLKDWSVCAPKSEENAELDAASEDVVFRSFGFTNVEQGEPKQFMFEGWNLRWDFLRRLIEEADGFQSTITIEVSKPDWVHAERLELEDAFAVTYWRLPLDPASFEEKSVAIADFLEQRQHQPNPWTKIAYFSKRSDLVIFVRAGMITITNNPSHIDFAESFGNIIL
ncbi:hypothetical protein AAVH_21204 [Aphelenchoides avenae]|nr:hypothetical protein AAVH_21204 [Aphelenchus avenae]